MGLRGLAPPYAKDPSCQALWSDWYTRGHDVESTGVIMLWMKAFGMWLLIVVWFTTLFSPLMCGKLRRSTSADKRRSLARI